MMGKRRGFTLLELLMAFGVSTILLATIYFFYFGILKTTTGGTAKIELNQICETTLQNLMNDLRLGYRFSELRPHRFVIQRVPAAPITSDELSNLSGVPLLPIEYDLVRDDKTRKTTLFRRESQAERGKEIFTVDECDPEIFKGYVLDLPQEKDDTMPKFHVFDTQTQPSGDLGKIALVRISLKLGVGADKIAVVSKAYLPFVHNATLQGNWNLE
jgi:prepilin-type N-terminal cleavage/methylation domain-containing protein